MLKNIIVIVLSVLALSLDAFGQANEYRGICVGINDYPGTGNDLRYCVNDAQQLKYRLRDHQGWLYGNIELITDSRATKSYILDQISALPQGSGNTSYFSYSGHGDYAGMYVVNEQYISPSELQSRFGSSYNQYASYIDACRSGVFPRDMTRGVISSACAVNEFAYESSTLQHGVFSYYLIQGLTNSAAGGSDGIVTAEELHAYAAPRTTNFESRQHPQLRDNFSGDLSLRAPVMVAPVISGFSPPSPITVYEYSSVTVSPVLSQGSGPIQYSWSAYYFPAGAWLDAYGDHAVINYYTYGKLHLSGDNQTMAPVPWIVCTAQNAAGSSTAEAVVRFVRFTGCPFVYTWDGSAWVKDNNVLPTSEFPQNVGRDVTDYYKLHQPLAPRDGNYVLQLRELDDEHSFLDQVKLLVIDHPRPAEIAITIDGEIVTFTTPMPPRAARHRNRDVTQELSARDGDFIRGKSGETVELQFERPSPTGGEGTSILLMEVRGDFSPKKIAGSIHSPKGEASTVSNFVLRERMSLIAVRLNSDGVGVNETVPESLDIAWHRDFLLDYVALAREPQIPVNIQELTLQRAVHSDGRDLSALLRSSDQSYSELLPGEHIELVFPAPAVRPGKRRSFLLVTQGRYIKADQDGKRVVESGGGLLPMLLRNYPNPFNPSTLISYSLPADGFVTLRVYNLLGQEVAQLANEQQRAGKHQIQFDVSSMASGVYVAKIAYTPVQAPVVSGEAGTPLKPEGTVIVTQRMMLVK